MLATLAGKLNGNESFNPDRGFHVDVVFVSTPGPGSGHRKRRLCTDDILEAVYTSVHDNAVKGTKTDIFVAALTTCHARLKLYESLDILQEQVLY